ncbi:RNA-binding domain-containing protein [Pholiota conissans]|uniref:RNA-binding domain-containing protein n=1 Tax=Pholiota conissans TaxID=109636 RepID=A0A9P5Z479_9AGAR|nr:RNA-binding domain-containing protein [Pholiota conissans]
MEEGTKTKKTIFIGGISDDTDETSLYENFSTFGDILEVQLPPPATQHHQNQAANAPKHRGFAFVTFSSSADAQDAIDNMDMNELNGRVLKVNLARPMKAAALNPQGNKAIWESEEWLKEHVKPLAQSGGVQGRNAKSAEAEEPQQKSDGEDNAMEE